MKKFRNKILQEVKFYRNFFKIKNPNLSLKEKILLRTINTLTLITVLIVAPAVILFFFFHDKCTHISFDVKNRKKKKKLYQHNTSKYLIHFISKSGHYDITFSKQSNNNLEEAVFVGRWYSCFSMYLRQIPYWVDSIGVYTVEGEKIAVFPIYTNNDSQIFIADQYKENKRIEYICRVDRKQIYLDNRNAKRLFN